MLLPGAVTLALATRTAARCFFAQEACDVHVRCVYTCKSSDADTEGSSCQGVGKTGQQFVPGGKPLASAFTPVSCTESSSPGEAWPVERNLRSFASVHSSRSCSVRAGRRAVRIAALSSEVTLVDWTATKDVNHPTTDLLVATDPTAVSCTLLEDTVRPPRREREPLSVAASGPWASVLSEPRRP